jgi:hypothetical protein
MKGGEWGDKTSHARFSRGDLRDEIKGAGRWGDVRQWPLLECIDGEVR